MERGADALGDSGNPGAVDSLKAVSRSIGALLVFLGLTVLAGWLFDVRSLRSLSPTFVTMKANSALSFVFTGAALWLEGSADRALRRHARIASVLVLPLSVLTLV